MTAPTQDAAFWDKIAPRYMADPIKDMAGYEDTLRRTQAYLKPTDTVLEVGCGTGMTALKHAPFVAHITATDVSAGMIAQARTRRPGAPNVTFAQAPADHPPEGPFDVVLALNLLHLVPDLTATLHALHARLPRGGLLISKTACLRYRNPLIRWMIPLMQVLGKAPHVNIFSEAALEQAIRDAGFDIVESTGRAKTPPLRFIVARRA